MSAHSCSASHCTRCGDCIDSHRSLCNDCRKVPTCNHQPSIQFIPQTIPQPAIPYQPYQPTYIGTGTPMPQWPQIWCNY